MKATLLAMMLVSAAMACTPNGTKGNDTTAQPVDETAQNDTTSADNARVSLPTTKTITIAMTGDIMMGTTFPKVQLPANEGRDLFSDTREITRRADIAVGNLEGAVCDGGRSTKGNGPNSYAFRMSTSYAPLLKDAGYDYLSLANNHARDFGDEGIASSERVLTEQGIAFSGIKGHKEWAVVELDGVRYGLCAFGHNSYTLRHSDLDKVKQILDELSQQADIIIVSFHGGAEGRTKNHLPYGPETFLGENRGDLRRFAHFCIDNGADVVYGHGPHVVRAMEVYKDRFIAYSLGNFCTPYGISLTGISGFSLGPRHDPQGSVAREIKQLTEADIQSSPIRISDTGEITINR